MDPQSKSRLRGKRRRAFFCCSLPSAGPIRTSSAKCNTFYQSNDRLFCYARARDEPGQTADPAPLRAVHNREVDPDFEAERQAAKATGLETALVDHSRVLEGAAAAAVARTPEGAGLAVYRGWMLKPNQYEAMHAGLLSRGVTLINTSEQYRTCHYLPESYPWIEGYTPRSVWFRLDGTLDLERLKQSIAPFGEASLIVKD